MTLEHYAAQGNRLIHELSYELGCDKKKAFRVFRSVLHALRDRMPPDDAIEFSQGLPLIMKGVFMDQYDLSRTPVRIRRADDFLHFIYLKAGRAAPLDFPDKQSVKYALSAVFFVLENHMDFGQISRAKNLLNRELVDMIEEF